MKIGVRKTDLSEGCCPLCRESVGEDDARCEGCRTAYHSECLTELGGCAVLGCSARPTTTARRDAIDEPERGSTGGSDWRAQVGLPPAEELRRQRGVRAPLGEKKLGFWAFVLGVMMLVGGACGLLAGTTKLGFQLRDRHSDLPREPTELHLDDPWGWALVVASFVLLAVGMKLFNEAKQTPD